MIARPLILSTHVKDIDFPQGFENKIFFFSVMNFFYPKDQDYFIVRPLFYIFYLSTLNLEPQNFRFG